MIKWGKRILAKGGQGRIVRNTMERTKKRKRDSRKREGGLDDGLKLVMVSGGLTKSGRVSQ